MTIRDYARKVGGKVVGRVGVEPTTKRLRAAFPSHDFTAETGESPLIQRLDLAPKAPSFEGPLRGISRANFWRLLALGYLAAFGLIGGTIYWLCQDPPAVVVQGAFRCDHSWRLPCDGAQ